LRRLVDKAVLAVDPDGANARHEEARHHRNVQHLPDDDGMGTIKARLSAEDAVLVYATLSLIARSFPATDPRTMDQRRADTSSTSSPTAPRPRPVETRQQQPTPMLTAGTTRTLIAPVTQRRRRR